jgi:hypothetical protein
MLGYCGHCDGLACVIEVRKSNSEKKGTRI